MTVSASLILFDLGNTLFLDVEAAWPRVYRDAEAALWKALRAAGVLSTPDALYGTGNSFLSYYYQLRGNGTTEPGSLSVLSRLLQEHGEANVDAAAAVALRAMYAVTQTNWRAARDAASTLRALAERGKRLGAVSNGSDHLNALELLDRAGLRAYFETVITSAQHGRRKPDPSIFQTALDRFGMQSSQAVMVGDSYEADVLGAHALGMQAIWVRRRLALRSLPVPTSVPYATVRSLRQLLRIIS